MDKYMIDDVSDRLTELSEWVTDLRAVLEKVENKLLDAQTLLEKRGDIPTEAVKLIEESRNMVEDI